MDEHHPFPGYRFRNDVLKTIHNAFNSAFLGHRAAWEAAFDIMDVAGSEEVFTDAHAEMLARRYGHQKSSAVTRFEENLVKIFGLERAVKRMIAVLNAFPWMPRGWRFWRIPRGKTAVLILPDGKRIVLGSRHAILVADYAVMKKARDMPDNHGLYPKDLESKHGGDDFED
jgi:hypothetical protein